MTVTTRRRLNYTKRQRITRDDVQLAIRKSRHGPLLSATLHLEAYDLDPEARVVVEVYRQSTIERVEAGPAGGAGRVTDHLLGSFGDGTGLLCRVKVISTRTRQHGRLLAVADRLRPENDYDDPGGRALLPFREDDSLGQRVWKLDTSVEPPTIFINPRLGDWRTYAKRPPFTSLVLPEVLGRIARWVVRTPVDEDEEHPANDWRAFLVDLGADFSEVDLDTDDERLDQWADDLVSTFCARHQLQDQLVELLEGVRS